nr:hypothetical protein [Tanacetum cinerariifolium]
TRLAYKGFDLSAVGAFQNGGILISTLYGSSSYLNLLNGRRGNVKVDYWTPDNTDAKYPKPGGATSGDNPKYGTTLSYFDASYLKIRSISLGYNFDNNAWLKKAGVSQLRFYVTAQNPFVFFSPYKNESGMDPETNSRADALWSAAFPNINTASGVIKNAAAVGTISPALVAEARFFRAFDYFMLAYDVATAGIASPGPFRLQPTYYDVNLATNDRNTEILLFADHTESDALYNGSSLTYSNGDGTDNFAGWMLTWNYPNIRSYTNANGTGGINSVQREASQALGRPWTRMAPTIDAIQNTFADKTNDSRYDGTFTTVYRGNWPKAGVANATLYNANNLPVTPGSPILTFLDAASTTGITYPTGAGTSNIGAGVMSGRADYVIASSGISRIVYPGLWKLGVYRTDNAAEAAVKGAATKSGQSARDLINVIRARAGKWRFDNNGNVAKVQDNSAAMTTATPATIDINYILAERSREYFAEGYRWYDLVRTQKWNELASTYRIAGTAY